MHRAVSRRHVRRALRRPCVQDVLQNGSVLVLLLRSGMPPSSPPRLPLLSSSNLSLHPFSLPVSDPFFSSWFFFPRSFSFFFCLMICLRCLGLFHLLERDPSFRFGDYKRKDLALLQDCHIVHSIRLMDTVATLFHLPWMKKVAQMHTRKVDAGSNSLVNPLTLYEGVRCLPERSDSILGEYSKESEHSRALSKQHRNRHPAVE